MGLKTPRAYEEMLLCKFRPFVQSALDKANKDAQAKATLAATGPFAPAEQKPYKEVTFEAWVDQVDFADPCWMPLKTAIANSITAKDATQPAPIALDLQQSQANEHAWPNPFTQHYPYHPFASPSDPFPQSYLAQHAHTERQARTEPRATYATVRPAAAAAGSTGSAVPMVRTIRVHNEEHGDESDDDSGQESNSEDPATPLDASEDDDDGAPSSAADESDVLTDVTPDDASLDRAKDLVENLRQRLREDLAACEALVGPLQGSQETLEDGRMLETLLGTAKLLVEAASLFYSRSHGWRTETRSNLSDLNRVFEVILSAAPLIFERTGIQYRPVHRPQPLARITFVRQVLRIIQPSLGTTRSHSDVAALPQGSYDEWRRLYDGLCELRDPIFMGSSPSTSSVSPHAAEAAAAARPAASSSPATVVTMTGDGSVASPWCLPAEEYAPLRDLMLGRPSAATSAPGWTVTSSSSPTATASATATATASFRDFASTRRASSRRSRWS